MGPGGDGAHRSPRAAHGPKLHMQQACPGTFWRGRGPRLGIERPTRPMQLTHCDAFRHRTALSCLRRSSYRGGRDRRGLALRSRWLGAGRCVAQFGRDFAQWRGVQASQLPSVSSRIAVLHVSIAAACLEPGSEVITTPLTFCATVNAILHANLPLLGRRGLGHPEFDLDDGSPNRGLAVVARHIRWRCLACHQGCSVGGLRLSGNSPRRPGAM